MAIVRGRQKPPAVPFFGDFAPAMDRGADRAKDRAKAAGEYEWRDKEVLYTVPEGEHAGYEVVYVKDAYDLAYLGHVQGHCAGTHFVWAIEEKTWYFMALLDAKGAVKDTIHCKWDKWVGKAHPRDPVGYHEFTSTLPKDVAEALAVVRQQPEMKKYNSGGYTSLPQIEAAYKACGKEYEPGKCKATFANATYGGGNDYYGGDVDSFDYSYGGFIIPNRPNGIDDELWNNYVKLMKNMKDTYDKKVGNVKVVGRVFNFDGKKIVVVSTSAYNKGYKPIYGDWLIEMNKKKSKEAVSG